MKPVLLIDFGSTYTKVTAVDAQSGELLGTASAFTTIETDVSEGLDKALKQLHARLGEVEFEQRYACSSAAGGLRMMASGLVPELTAEAARQAALGAGAKLIKTFSHELTPEDIAEIERSAPDIFLLTGGTDGGNTACIEHNAKKLGEMAHRCPIVIAGNRSSVERCVQALDGKEVYVTENVMPNLGVLNIDAAQSVIRKIFLKNIVAAKGLSRLEELVSGILMPTPSAVLEAMKLLADGARDTAGFGELVGIDLGGATTDVYSIAKGLPRLPTTLIKGLEQPYAKRTVEADIGMRYNIRGIADAAGIDHIAEKAGISPCSAAQLMDRFAQNPGLLPEGAEEEALDAALAACAIEVAVARHAGTLEKIYTPLGESYYQSGKDLCGVGTLVLTGGAIIHNPRAAKIASAACYNAADPFSLRPMSPQIYIDRNYILPAMGLLAQHAPETALKMMKENLETEGVAHGA